MNNSITQNNEINELIDRISQKYGYDDELKGVLNKMIPVMTKGKSDEEKQMLYATLERVKIFVLDENPTKEQIEKCKQEIMGDVNKGVTFIDEDRGEYSKNIAPGAYVNEPVFDDDMNVIDRRGFLYVSRLSEYSGLAKIYGTTINLSHLVHELGHAWASEKDEFVQNDDGTITNNVGACTIYSKVDREKKEVIPAGYDGLLIEEALNSIEEEDILCDMLNIDSIDELKEKGYVKSNYQGLISNIMRSYLEKFGKEDFHSFRVLKDRDSLKDIEAALENTEAWQILKTDEYTKGKRQKFESIDDLQVSDGAKQIIRSVIEKYDDVYFPDNSKFTPMQKLENVFMQIYNFGIARINFGINNEHNRNIYLDIATAMTKEAYVPRNQIKEYVKSSKEVEKSGFLSELKAGVKTDEEIASTKIESDVKERIVKESEDKTLE